MPGNSPLNTASGSLSSKRAGEWAADVHLFFSEEWSRLRSLIMSMEEESWNNATAICDAQAPSFSAGTGSESESAKTRIPNRSGERMLNEQEAISADRLVELERRIEQRLRIASARRR